MKEFFTKLAGIRPSPIGRRKSVHRIGDYSIVRKVGSGGTSDVYLGLHVDSMATAAIKLLHPRSGAASHRDMFVVESMMCGRVDHPNVVSMYGANLEDPAGPHLVMEYVDGHALERFDKPEALLPVETLIDVIRQSAEALRYLASEGIIHRDIKPGNILLRKDGRVKIADFGCALFSNYPSESLRVAGSMPYMAPEQLTGKPLTPLCDMYSLGAVFYHLLTGHQPIVPDDDQAPNEYARKILHSDPTPVAEYRSDVHPSLVRVIDCMLQKRPEDRYDSWDAFLLALYRASLENYAEDEELSEHWRSIEIYRQEQAASHEYDFSFGF